MAFFTFVGVRDQNLYSIAHGGDENSIWDVILECKDDVFRGDVGVIRVYGRLTRVKFWLESASSSSSLWSEVGTPKIIPLLMAAVLLGKELLIF